MIGRDRLSWVLPLALLVLFACSTTTEPAVDVMQDQGSVDADPGQDVSADTSVFDGLSPDQGGDVSLQDTADATQEVTTPAPPEWSHLPMGAKGDILRVRFLGADGFRMTGQGGTILRPLAGGWIRQWTPHTQSALRDIHRSPDGFYAVGDGGAWWTLDETGHWSALDPGVIVDLRGLTQMGLDTLGVGDQGIILRLKDGAFSQELTGVSTNLHSIDATSEVEAIAVGNGGQVLKRVLQKTACPESADGLCSPCDDVGDCVSGVCEQFFGEDQSLCTVGCTPGSASCPEGMFCNEGSDDAAHCAPDLGYAWLSFTVADSDVVLHDVLALDSQNVWAVGTQAKVIHYNGQWSGELTNLGNQEDLLAVAQGAGYVVSVGANGAVVGRSPSGDWNLQTDVVGPLNTDLQFHGVAIGAGSIIVAGEGGGMLIKELPDGDFHDAQATPTSTILDIQCANERCLMVGEDGLWIEVDLDGYGAIDTTINEHLRGCAVDDDGTYWAVGDSGVILRKTPHGPIQVVPSPTTLDLRAIAQDAHGDLVAVGAVGVILNLGETGAQVEMEQSPTLWDLNDVFLQDDALISVGDQGTVLQSAPDGWILVDTFTQSALHAGDATTDKVVIAGADGVVLLGDNVSTLTVSSIEPTGQYRAVHILSDGTAVVAGWNGQLRLLETDGGWSPLSAPSQEPIFGVSMLGTELIIAGVNAQIWTHEDLSFLREGSPSTAEVDEQ